MLPRLTRNRLTYIEERAAQPDGSSVSSSMFLLAPRIRRSCRPRSGREKAPSVKYGDFVMETDAALGAIRRRNWKHMV